MSGINGMPKKTDEPNAATVNLSFRYSETDYVRALRAHYASRLRLRLDIGVAVLLAGGGAYLWRSPASHWFGVGCLVASVSFALFLLAAFTVIPRFTFHREPKFRDDYSLRFSEDGIHFRTAHIDSQLQWTLYSSALIDTHSYVLYYGIRRFTIIPKRVFASPEQRRAFEQMLTQHVPQITRRDT